VQVDYFVGRENELNRLFAKVEQSATGTVNVEFLSGERGIGKTSLASFLRHVSEQNIGVFGVHVFLGGVSTLEEMARRVIEQLILESREKSWFDSIFSMVKEHIRGVGLFNVSLEFRPPIEVLHSMVSGFAESLRGFNKKLSNNGKGLLIILDDINGLAKSQEFANWFKSLVDSIAVSRDRLPVTFVFVGYDQRRRSLISLQPSLARVFDPIELAPWDDAHTADFFSKAFSKASLAVSDDAMNLLCWYTGGLPMLAHEIGESVFMHNTDEIVDKFDAARGIKKAAEIVGAKYLEPQVLAPIKSDKYKGILKKLVMVPGRESFARADIMNLLNDSERAALGKFLSKMKDLQIITAEPEFGPGHYKFTSRLHYLYFRIKSELEMKKTDR